jgi:hypothetical protein
MRARLGDFLRSASEICRDGHEARPVEVVSSTGATDADGTPRARSTVPDRQGDEARVVTLFQPYQDRVLAFRTDAGDRFAYVRRR